MCLSTVLPPLHADKTTRGRLQPDKALIKGKKAGKETIRIFDTICNVAATDIRISGFDKPLSSRKETMLVSNYTDREISGLKIRFTYTDTRNRMLHEEVKEIRVTIPVGETRRIEIPSWDTQQSFYYSKSRRPRTANVTPFDVVCKVMAYYVLVE